MDGFVDCNKMAKANARFVETAKPGKYGDASTKGLQLVRRAGRSQKVGVPVHVAGKAREMGLGSFPVSRACRCA